jgi:hypothetical protein
MAEAPEDIVDELYDAPVDEFIARRDARAKELRKSDRSVADAVKKLRKPSVSAAAVNRLVRSSPDDTEALLAAGEALRQAQLGGGDRDAVRSAARDEREAVEKLVGAAGGLSPGALEEVRETLHAAASDDEARELVRRGVLTEALRPMGFGAFGVVSGRGARSARGSGSAPAKPKPKPKPDPKADRARAAEAKRQAAAERKAEAERRRAAKERVKAARAALRDAEKAAAAAEKVLERADREASAARDEVDRRRQELEDAERA